MIKAIIFDCGGVLLKKERNRDLVTILANAIGVPPNSIRPLWEKHHDNLLTGDLTSKEFIGALADELNYQYNVNEIYSKWAEKIGITKSSINHNLINYIKTLRQKYKVYILSNMIDLAEEDEALKLFRKNFDGYFTSYQFGSRKPQPEIFRKLLAKINLKPDECIFVDDNQKNISASSSFGFHSIQYENAKKLKKKLTGPLPSNPSPRR